MRLSTINLTEKSMTHKRQNSFKKSFFKDFFSDKNFGAQGVYAVVVVVLGLGAWIFVLRKLKAGVSEFKNALRLFPAEVIFGSFLLKNFLMKTSKSAIEYVKH